jgi:hypothetical protein
MLFSNYTHARARTRTRTRIYIYIYMHVYVSKVVDFKEFSISIYPLYVYLKVIDFLTEYRYLNGYLRYGIT